MPDHGSAQFIQVTSDERIRSVLKRHIQRAYDLNNFTRATLAAESGVSVAQIDQIVSSDPAKQRRVTVEDAFCLVYTLGEPAVSALLATIHYSASRQGSGSELALSEMVATSLQHFSTIATAAADGRIDHTEAPSCRDAADGLIATFLPLSSHGVKA